MNSARQDGDKIGPQTKMGLRLFAAPWYYWCARQDSNLRLTDS